MSENTARRLRIGIGMTIILMALLILYTLYRTPAPWGWHVARAAALFGYSTIFLTILSNEYMREMKKLFGRPFLRVHHILSVVGLILIVVHPITVALVTKDISAFIPRFDSFSLFLTLGGRPALYLFMAAALAAVLRRRIKNVWRSIHWLNYVAFSLAFVHSWLLGANVSHGLFKFIWPAMFAIALIVFVHKRLQQRQVRKA
jgi:DMSO/TMAO reductase YedYZ heme-binding membrane subunit